MQGGCMHVRYASSFQGSQSIQNPKRRAIGLRWHPTNNHHTGRTMPSHQPSADSHIQKTLATMQSLPDARSQSFDELYGEPENKLEIEVCCGTAHLVSQPCSQCRVHRS
jgi:hypothetical protein